MKNEKRLGDFYFSKSFFIAILLGNVRYCVVFRSHIITYQEKLGNYNPLCDPDVVITIITYQEKLGNYNSTNCHSLSLTIITYQEKLGNYNFLSNTVEYADIITYQEKLGNYNEV